LFLKRQWGIGVEGVFGVVFRSAKGLPCSGQGKTDTELSGLRSFFVFIGADISEI
jgi:hypothetical protein